MTALPTPHASSSSRQPRLVAVPSLRLFYNYLRFSPSYAAGLVHRMRGGLRRVTRRGRRILSCVNKYADVYTTGFEQWLAGPGAVRIAQYSGLPEILQAHELKVSDASDLFLRFPQGKNALPQLQLLALIAAKVPSISRRRLGLRLTPVVEKTLWRDVYLTYLIKNYPETELWRLGAEAMLVDRFIGKVEPTGRRMNASQDHERRLLVATVIRHREWAHNIAEHAAVDHFPCKEAVTDQQMCLALPAVDLTRQLADHAREESLFARQQVLVHTKASGRVPSTPYLREQGVLF